ncbi:SPOR domain-containing protein [Consotaella salsifontis]|uniref:Sporulation related domain-containing protein n=1 Tax=Consotaella salsifontis TaxID=1365950 RepID=A0A1T4R4D8_9HYPH|nr:SPOR domain-containing protein [Consotaella salsifontis]SKA10910.1 Sporulation related domain-containing protein [Consotaella salsifontis]
MADTKGLARGITFEADAADDDPFAELAKLVEQPLWHWPQAEARASVPERQSARKMEDAAEPAVFRASRPENHPVDRTAFAPADEGYQPTDARGDASFGIAPDEAQRSADASSPASEVTASAEAAELSDLDDSSFDDSWLGDEGDWSEFDAALSQEAQDGEAQILAADEQPEPEMFAAESESLVSAEAERAIDPHKSGDFDDSAWAASFEQSVGEIFSKIGADTDHELPEKARTAPEAEVLAFEGLDQQLADELEAHLRDFDLDDAQLEGAFADLETELQQVASVSAATSSLDGGRGGAAAGQINRNAGEERVANPISPSAYSSWVRPKVETAPVAAKPDVSPVANSAGAKAAVTSSPKTPDEPRFADDEELELALQSLSAPLRPRDSSVVVTPSFAPEAASRREPEPAPLPLDDFDELIASQLAVLRGHPNLSTTEQGEVGADEEPNAETADDHVSESPKLQIAEDANGAAHSFEEQPLPSWYAANHVAHKAPPKRLMLHRRSALVAASVVALMIVGGAAWQFAGSSSGGGDGGTLLVKADMEPVKIKPENPGGQSIPNQNKAVYERVDADRGTITPPERVQKTLIASEEEPVDIAPEEEDQVDALPGVGMMEQDVVPSKEDARLAENASSGEDSPVPILQPRRVRTVSVRADGSVVPGSDTQDEPGPAAAQQQMASLAQSPEAREVGLIKTAAPVMPSPAINPPAEDTAPLAQAAAASGEAALPAEEPVSEEPVSENAAPENVASAAPDTPAEAAAEPVPATVSAPLTVPVPHARPGTQPLDRVQVASATPQPPSHPAAATIASSQPAAPTAQPASGGYYVQIASQPSEEAARQSFQNLSSKYGNILSGHGIVIQSAEIAGRGTYYRVRVTAASQSDASNLCSQLKAAGGSCFVSR